MGICQSMGKKRNEIITANEATKNNNYIQNKEKGEKDNNNLLITHNYEVQYTNFQTKAIETSSQYKILSFPQEKHVKTPSTISSNSTASRAYTPHSPMTFIIEATIGEIEIPIFFEKNENLIIKINENNNIQNTWSFLQNKNPVNYLGYPDYKYNNINIGALFLRITGSQKIYPLNNSINTFKSNSKGSLLFWANLDPNDFSIYEPKGSLQITINGGNYFYEKELNSPYDINNNTKNKNDLINDYILKEKKIFKYINKARNDIAYFVKNYFYINDKDEVNQELIRFISKNNFQRKELKYNKELNNIAKEHCEYLCKNGTTGETNEYNIKIVDIIKNKCHIFFSSVNIVYGINNPLLIVKRMIRDKYSKLKNNRNNLLFHQYNNIGICLREHMAYKYCCVITFSE